MAKLQALPLPAHVFEALAPLIALWGPFQAELEAADERLVALAKVNAAVTRLRTMPSIGPVTALVSVASLDDVERVPCEDGFHHTRGSLAHARPPRDEARRTPLKMLLMLGWAMGGLGGVPALVRAARMGGDARAVLQHFQHRGGETDRDLRADEAVRHAVEMALDGDVVVDVHLRRLPLGELIAVCWQRTQRGALCLFKDGAPTPGELLKRAVIHLLA
ncbi:MAG: hypothetical protein ABJE47_23390, partial [bacterium]